MNDHPETLRKLTIALACLRSIAKYGGDLPSDGLAKEALAEMGEPEERPVEPTRGRRRPA